MNKKLIDWWAGGASYDSDYQAWLTQIVADGGTQPSASVKTAQNALVVGLKAAGLFTRMKAGWFLHAGDKTTCRRNIASPSTFRLTEVNTVTFLEGNGCKSDGTSYWNTGYAANQYSGIETDLTGVAYVSESSTASETTAIFGMRVGTSAFIFRIRPKFSANGDSDHYGNGPSSVHTNANHKGLYVLTYNSSNLVLYKDGTVLKSEAVPGITAPLIAAPMLICARNSNAGGGATGTEFYLRYTAYCFLFNSFSAADESALRGLLTTYNSAAGLP